ncbi:hypothetical protein B0H13DRAFT_1642282, partial [Mycena leptocephala]
FIGTILNWAFCGILVIQVGVYYSVFSKDRTFVKILVGFVFVVELLETLANTRDAMRIFAIRWGDVRVLDEVGWAWFSTPIIGSISAALGQGYFAWRIHLVGKTLYIPALIMAVPRILCSTSLLLTNIQLQITLVQLGAGVWSGVEICLAKEFSQLQTKNLRPTAVNSSDSTVAEI